MALEDKSVKTITPSATEVLLTPHDVALAIGVSESSVRRWIDAGDLRVTRTAGGHRRVALPEAVRWVRRIGVEVTRPEVLGLGALPADARGIRNIDERLIDALTANDSAAARRLVLAEYLRGQSLAGLFDDPIREAMHRLGNLWEQDERGILIEHAATQTIHSVLGELRDLIPAPETTAPAAVGGGPAGDPYGIPSRMVSILFKEAGWNATDFGPNTPISLLADEAIHRDACLAWLSASSPVELSFLADLEKLADRLRERGIAFLVGGAGLNGHTLASNITRLATMGELAAYLRGAERRTPRKRSPARKATG